MADDRTKALSLIYTLVSKIDAKDHRTYLHSKRVSDYAASLAEALNLSAAQVFTVRAAGLLHDVGMVQIPDAILKKKGPLDPSDWYYIKTHPSAGVEMLMGMPELSACLPAIRHHHERYDGTGYPSGLKGEEIPIEARILTIAEAFETISSRRFYRPEDSPIDAFSEIKRCAGAQFDPKLVMIFCNIKGVKDTGTSDQG